MIETIKLWLKRDPDPKTRAELEDLLAAGNQAALAACFDGRLQFGTAGLRAPMGAGPRRMNRLVVQQTTAGVATYLLERVPGVIAQGVVVGFDGRHQSKQFAHDAAGVFAAFGIPVHLAPKPVPTPLCAYAQRELGANAAVVLTASHNPPEYNGYKLYWTNGAQIVPPHDSGIASAIDRVAQSEIPSMSYKKGVEIGLIRPIRLAISHHYIQAVRTLTRQSSSRTSTSLSIAYTPLHGVGAHLSESIFQSVGYTIHTVPSQREPNGDFPTVPFPNPEEPGAMDAVIALAKETEADLALAHDPDADRLAVGVRTSTGSYEMLTGDEVGVLLGEDRIKSASKKGWVGTTCVSSRLLSKIAAAHQVGYFETLTGFKWIANTAMAIATREHPFLMGYEEAIGYTIGELVRDKDGISAGVAIANLAAREKHHERTLIDLLERIYREYGLYLTRQRSIRMQGSSNTQPLGQQLRATPPTHIAGRQVIAIKDLLNPDESLEAAKIPLPPSDVFIMLLEGDTRVSIRPSGTEPKVKCYYEVTDKVGPNESFEAAKKRANQTLNDLIERHQAELLEIL